MKELAFKPMKARFRATFAAGGVNEPRLGSIDKESEVIHDVQITLEGEARGHGIWLDRQFCEDVAAAGNAMGDAGVKVRFGHPAMCSDALGTYLGRAKNFRTVDLTRKDGTPAAGVIADIHIADEAHHAPSGDLAAWTLETAEKSPDTFGQSIVFTYADFKVKDADGVEHSYNAEVLEADEKERKTTDQWLEQSAYGRVYVVLGKLHGTDFTDTPAATDGVFSATDLASEAEAMLDEHPQIMETLERHPDNVYQFLARVGILDRIESKRVAGLQAAKDKEIAELKDQMAAQTKAHLDALAAMEADAKASDENFKAQIKTRDEELAAARADVERLTAEIETVRTELAEKGKQLDFMQKRIASLGHAVNRVPETKSAWTAKYRQALAEKQKKGK